MPPGHTKNTQKKCKQKRTIGHEFAEVYYGIPWLKAPRAWRLVKNTKEKCPVAQGDVSNVDDWGLPRSCESQDEEIYRGEDARNGHLPWNELSSRIGFLANLESNRWKSHSQAIPSRNCGDSVARTMAKLKPKPRTSLGNARSGTPHKRS